MIMCIKETNKLDLLLGFSGESFPQNDLSTIYYNVRL